MNNDLVTRSEEYRLNMESRMSRLETLVTTIKDNHLVHIERKVDELLEKGPSPTEWVKHLEMDDDHELRIRGLEHTQWARMGAIGVLTGILSMVGNILIGHYFK